MEKANNTVQINAQIASFLLIWLCLVLATHSYSPSNLLPVFKQIPQAISIYTFFVFLFVKRIWRWQIFQGWFIKIPDLQGTWKGELRSDWINPQTQKGIDPIPLILVIKQTFSSIQVILMTKESTSYSTAAAFNHAYGSDDVYLSYTYSNRPKATIRDRSAIHDGAAILKVIKQPNLILEGEYWTGRKTRGEIILSFESKELAEKF